MRSRHLALPLDQYAKLDGFGTANAAFVESAVELGAEAVGGALEAAGLTPQDVDMILFTSVTGVAAPSVDARLAGPAVVCSVVHRGWAPPARRAGGGSIRRDP